MLDVKKNRNIHIGGSDIPIIMELSPFKKRFELLQEKANIITNDFEGNEYTEYGNIMEPKIREYINKEYNREFLEYEYSDEVEKDIVLHLDGYDSKGVLEIKTTSQIKENVDDYKIYLVQLLTYMYYTKQKNGMLVVYKRPEDFSTDFDVWNLDIYEINIEDYEELVKEILVAINQFRYDLEKIKENPNIEEIDLIDTDLIMLSNKVINLENQLNAIKEIEKQYSDLKNELYEQMLSHNKKSWVMPNGKKITLVKPSEDKEILKFNEDKFKEENEELYKTYLESKIMKGKKGYVKIS